MELYTRVLQVEWPVNGVISFHFARGLLAEAMGDEVSWAEFGYKATHPHQARSHGPRLLPKFETLDRPLQPLLKVVPRTRFEVSWQPRFNFVNVQLPVVRYIRRFMLYVWALHMEYKSYSSCNFKFIMVLLMFSVVSVVFMPLAELLTVHSSAGTHVRARFSTVACSRAPTRESHAHDHSSAKWS